MLSSIESAEVPQRPPLGIVIREAVPIEPVPIEPAPLEPVPLEPVPLEASNPEPPLLDSEAAHDHCVGTSVRSRGAIPSACVPHRAEPGRYGRSREDRYIAPSVRMP